MKVIDYQPNSSNFNPIENLWKKVKDRVQRMCRLHNKDQMWTLVNLTWEDIPQESIKKLISTMPNRMEVMMVAQGGSI